MPKLIFRFNKESKSLKMILIKGPKLSTEQSLKMYDMLMLSLSDEYNKPVQLVNCKIVN